jgi:two-component system, OmpR family, sensor kinase
MSLRVRLTLQYTTLVGGVLLIFGALVYGLVNLSLLIQVDNELAQSSYQIIDRLRVNASSEYDVRSLSNFQFSGNLVFQIWDTDRVMVMSRPPRFTSTIDAEGLRVHSPTYRTITSNSEHLRVLSIPLQTQRDQTGYLQVALNLQMLDATNRALLMVLLIIALISILTAFLATWVITGQALAPLAMVTEIATQITRADDLQRRIPMNTSPGNEIGRLITAFNQTLEQLERLFTAQRRFMADMSHELRTPLTVIKGNIGLMRKLGTGDDESLMTMDGEVDRLTRLVNNLLFLAQAESGSVPFEMSVTELDTLLLDVYQQMRPAAGDRQLRLTSIDQVLVMGDKDRLKQVMLNLIGNAIQYTPSGGMITLSLGKTTRQGHLTVSDTGPGIPAEDLPHIFERFYRGEKSRKRVQGTGFGLGLSISHWIIRNHGGTIEVTSQEGKGSTFCVWLPLYNPATPQK